MKKVFLALALVTVLASCGTKVAETTVVVAPETTVVAPCHVDSTAAVADTTKK